MNNIKSLIIGMIIAILLWIPGSLILYKLEVLGYVYAAYLCLCTMVMILCRFALVSGDEQ